MKRISVVDAIKVNSLIFSSVFEIGDSTRIAPVSQALAVQREVPIFFTNEADFSKYPIFSRDLPKVEIDEEIRMDVYQHNPVIKVNTVRILGCSTSSIVHIGSTDTIEAQSKVKHIRKLLGSKYEVEKYR